MHAVEKSRATATADLSDTLFTFNQHETTTRVGSPKVQVYRGPMDRGCDRNRHTDVARCVEGQGGPRPCRLNTPPTPCVKRHRYMAKGLRRSRATLPGGGWNDAVVPSRSTNFRIALSCLLSLTWGRRPPPAPMLTAHLSPHARTRRRLQRVACAEHARRRYRQRD